MNDNELMKSIPIPQSVAKMAIPSIISSLVTVVYNMADTFFVGQTGDPLQVAAVSLTNPIFILFMAFANMFGMGGSAVASMAMGEKKEERAKKASAFVAYASFFMGIVFAASLLLFMRPLLTLFGADAQTYALARGYTLHISYGAPFIIWSAAASFVVRADGASREAMIGSMIGTIANIVLDPVFISGLGMGAAGAAIATTIGNIVSFLIVFQYLFHTKSFQLKASDFVPDLPVIGQIGKLGFSSFLTQLSIVIITIVSMNMLAKYGAQSKYGANDPQAIIGMVMKVFTIAVNLAVGISAGCQPIFGFNYGAGRYDRVRKLLAWSCGACCASASLQQFYSRRSRRRSSAFSGQIHRTRRSIWNLAQGRCASICC